MTVVAMNGPTLAPTVCQNRLISDLNGAADILSEFLQTIQPKGTKALYTWTQKLTQNLSHIIQYQLIWILGVYSIRPPYSWLHRCKQKDRILDSSCSACTDNKIHTQWIWRPHTEFQLKQNFTPIAAHSYPTMKSTPSEFYASYGKPIMTKFTSSEFAAHRNPAIMKFTSSEISP